MQMILYPSSVLCELRIQQTTHVFDHDGARLNHAHEFNHGGKKITLVVGAQLLTRVGKRRAGHAAGHQVNSSELVSVLLDPGDDVALDDVPFRTVLA